MHFDLDKWTPFKKSLCQSCVANCCREWPVEVSVPDLIRLELMTSDEAALSLKKVITKLKRQGILQSFAFSSWVGILNQKPNKDCIFLNEQRRCSVYAKRPEICRQFPKIGPKPRYCPFEAAG
jgi:Fe-S-cluster containining protein